MPTVLITGANRGIGLEFAKQYAAAGWTVHATARDPAKAKALKAIKGVAVHKLDIGDMVSIAAFARSMKRLPVDVLINNAGVGGSVDRCHLGKIDYADFLETVRINGIAPLMLTEAVLDNLALGKRKALIFISSRAGSIGNTAKGGRYNYRVSKSTLNMVVRLLSFDLAPRGIVTCAVHPGWVRTDMGGDGAPIDAARSVTGLRDVIDRLEHHDNGHFINYDGRELPW